MGTILVGHKEIMNKAMRVRKVLGGGMRQVGYMAAAGLYALDHHLERLTNDHRKAVELGIRSIVPVKDSEKALKLISEPNVPITGDWKMRYQVNLGIQDGAVVWSDPEQIAMNEDDLEVFWRQNPDAEEERRVVWTRLVSPYLEGELPNGMDDNGNGLIDEEGLSFTVDRNSVTIRITLQRQTADGELTTKTMETVVTCRNLGDVE